VFIQRLRVDRCGAIADLEIDLLKEGLTVVHGRAATAKSLLIDFVRGMLFGSDERSPGYLAGSVAADFSGALTLVDGVETFTISRDAEQLRTGRYTLQRRNGSQITGRDTEHPLTGISLRLFDAVYAIDFARRPQLSELLDEAVQNGFLLFDTPLDSPRLASLRQKLVVHEEELQSLPKADEPYDVWRMRRTSLQSEISNLERALARQRERAREQVNQIPELEQRLRDLRSDLRGWERKKEALEVQRRGKLEQIELIESARQDVAPYRVALEGVEKRITRWEAVLVDLRERQRQFGGLTEREAKPGSNEADPRHEVRSLEKRLRDLQHALHEQARENPRWQSPTIAQSLDEIQQRLADVRREWGGPESGAHPDHAYELNQLRRSETELQLSLGYLQHERQGLMARLGDERQREEEVVRLEKELDALDHELAQLDHQRDELRNTIDEIEIQLRGLRRKDQTDDFTTAERLAGCRNDLERLERKLQQAERREQLEAVIADLRQQITALEQTGREVSLVREATPYLRRLSAGHFVQLHVGSDQTVTVEDVHGQRWTWHELRPGGRDQLYLSFALATADGLARRGLQLPLVLHGTLTNYESNHLSEAAETLRDFAARGRQMLLLTRHEHVASVFRLFNVATRSLAVRLPGQTEDHDAELPANHHLVRVRYRHREWDLESAELREPGLGSIGPRWSNASGRLRDAITGGRALDEQTPIELGPSIDADTAARLRAVGVTTIGELLQLQAARANSILRNANVSWEFVQSWQAQTRLIMQMPSLRVYDARILAACGIQQADQLEQLGTAEVRSLIERFAATSDGRAMLLSGTEYELSRITDWARGATEEELTDQPWEAAPARTTGRSGRTRSHAVSATATAPTTQGSASKTAQTAAATISENSHAEDLLPLRDGNKGRFHLSLHSPVRQAPSIGERSAEQLESTGIRTVGDLLDWDPDELATHLTDRRLNADTIEQWQCQAELVCRVPQLRNSDAQILVALGINEAEQLAESDPRQLWKRVAELMETPRGKRFVRNQSEPTAEDIRNWVEWAEASRSLEEAA